MKSHLVTALPALAIGLAIGIAVPRGSHPIEDSTESKTSPAPSARNRSGNPDQDRLKALERILNNPSDSGDAMAGIPLEDSPLAITAIAKRSGIKGLGSRDKNLIRSLMERWYQKNPNATLAWLEAQPEGPNRQFYLECILARVANDDISNAVALMERCGSRESTSFEVPHDLMTRCVKADPELLVRACAATLCRLESGSGWNVDFPAKFDFRHFLDRTAEKMGGVSPYLSQSSYPANILNGWTKQNPQAAFEWVKETETAEWKKRANASLGMSDFFRAYASIEEPPAYGQFVAQVFAGESDPNKAARLALSALVSKADSAATAAFLEAATDAKSRAPVIESLIRASSGRYDSFNDAYRHSLFALLTPGERSAFLNRPPAETGLDGRTRSELEKSRKVLGEPPASPGN